MIERISASEKYMLYEYVNKNIQDTILRTFLTLWDERRYWRYKPLVYTINGKIAGFVAYTMNEKYPGKLKIYYLYVSEEFRGQGISKMLLEYCFSIAKQNNLSFYFVSEENSDGFKLFKDKFVYNIVLNEFETNDYVFDIQTNSDTLFTIKEIN